MNARLLYVWGGMAWYYRVLAGLTYATGVPAVAALGLAAWQCLRTPVAGSVALLALALALVAMWAWWAHRTWADGESRVVRLALEDDGTLVVTTLHGRTRREARADLGAATYQDRQGARVQAVLPLLIVAVRDQRPLRLELDAQVTDRAALRQLFPHPALDRYFAAHPA